MLRRMFVLRHFEQPNKMKNFIKKNPEFFNEIIMGDEWAWQSEQAKNANFRNNKSISTLSEAAL